MNFLNKYNNDKNIRFKSFEKTFELCIERNLKVSGNKSKLISRLMENN